MFILKNSSKSEENGTALPLELLWHFCAVTSSTMTFVSLYLFMRVLCFVKRYLLKNSNGHDQSPGKSRTPSERGDTVRTISLEEEKQNRSTSQPGSFHKTSEQNQAKYSAFNFNNWKRDPGKWMYVALLGAYFLNILRVLEEQVLIYAGNSSDFTCNLLYKLMIILTALTILFCHIFLWLRQAIFYKHPLLKHLLSHKVKALSTSSIFLILSTHSLTLFLHIWWREYKRATFGCFPVPELDKVEAYVPFTCLAVSIITIQISLTSLYVHPIVSHNREKRQLGAESFTNGQSEEADKLLKCVRKALVGASIGVGTDAAGAFGGMWLPTYLPSSVLSVMIEANILLNLLCCLYTFKKGFRVLSPFCCKK